MSRVGKHKYAIIYFDGQIMFFRFCGIFSDSNDLHSKSTRWHANRLYIPRIAIGRMLFFRVQCMIAKRIEFRAPLIESKVFAFQSGCNGDCQVRSSCYCFFVCAWTYNQDTFTLSCLRIKHPINVMCPIPRNPSWFSKEYAQSLRFVFNPLYILIINSNGHQALRGLKKGLPHVFTMYTQNQIFM